MVLIGLASAALAITYVLATPNPKDDVYLFNRFVKTAVHEGRIDLTIPCLQGTSFFAIPIYWLTGMEQPVIFTNALLTVFIPIAAFLAGRAWFGEKAGTVVVALVLFQPYEVLTVLRGWNHGPQMLFLFLVLWLLKREDRFSSLGAMEFDSQGRLYVADRGNHRIQILRPGREPPRHLHAVQPDQRAVYDRQRHALCDRFGVECGESPRLEDRCADWTGK